VRPAVEQKNGFLTETADGLAKRHAEMAKGLAVLMGRTVDGLLARLMRRVSGPPVIT
jgi:hypothetical protein